MYAINFLGEGYFKELRMHVVHFVQVLEFWSISSTCTKALMVPCENTWSIQLHQTITGFQDQVCMDVKFSLVTDAHLIFGQLFSESCPLLRTEQYNICTVLHCTLHCISLHIALHCKLHCIAHCILLSAVQISRCCSSSGQRWFFYYGCKLWNYLSNDLKLAENVNTFKHCLQLQCFWVEKLYMGNNY